jgi:hypothetical protein
MEKANEQFFAKNSRLSTEFSKYVLEHPEIDDLLTDETVVVFLPEFDAELRTFNREIAKEVENQGGQVLYVKVKEMMTCVPTRLIGVEIDTRDGVWMSAENG